MGGHFSSGKHFPESQGSTKLLVLQDVFQSHLLQKVLVGEESGFCSALKVHPCCSESWWGFFGCWFVLGIFFFPQGVCAKQFLQSWSVDSLARHAEN